MPCGNDKNWSDASIDRNIKDREQTTTSWRGRHGSGFYSQPEGTTLANILILDF